MLKGCILFEINNDVKANTSNVTESDVMLRYLLEALVVINLCIAVGHEPLIGDQEIVVEPSIMGAENPTFRRHVGSGTCS